MNDFLNQFQFPPDAQDFINSGLVQKTINSGGGGSVSTFQMSGHDKGVPFRFFLLPVEHKVKSELFDMEINDEIEMIEWFVTKDHKPVERVHMIGDGLLRFAKEKSIDLEGRVRMVVKRPFECTGGEFKEAYLTWKAGKESLGLPLERWELTLAQVKSFNSIGVFSVQQLASMPRNRVESMPDDLKEAFERSIRWVNAQKPMQDVQKYADEMVELKRQIAKQAQENEALRLQMNQLASSVTAPKKKAGRPKKIIQTQGMETHAA